MVPPLTLLRGGESADIGKAADADANALLSPRQQEAKQYDPLLRVCQMRFASVGGGTQQVGELREPAKVCVIDASKQTDELAKRVATLLDDEWLVDELFGKPTVAILVTGGAQDFKMLPRVQRVFREGLVKAAQVRRRRRPMRPHTLPPALSPARPDRLTAGLTPRRAALVAPR